jgi:hypothetical protein
MIPKMDEHDGHDVLDAYDNTEGKSKRSAAAGLSNA